MAAVRAKKPIVGLRGVSLASTVGKVVGDAAILPFQSFVHGAP
jgi:hypothetical protein